MKRPRRERGPGSQVGRGPSLALAAGAPGARTVVEIAGVISCLAGVLDLAAAAREGIGNGAATDFMGGDPDECPDRYAVADPLSQERPTYACAAQIGWKSPWSWQLAHFRDLVDAGTEVVGSVGDMRTDPAPAIGESPANAGLLLWGGALDPAVFGSIRTNFEISGLEIMRAQASNHRQPSGSSRSHAGMPWSSNRHRRQTRVGTTPLQLCGGTPLRCVPPVANVRPSSSALVVARDACVESIGSAVGLLPSTAPTDCVDKDDRRPDRRAGGDLGLSAAG
jgi:hypothetical protein